jgi:hypothetical protein
VQIKTLLSSTTIVLTISSILRIFYIRYASIFIDSILSFIVPTIEESSDLCNNSGNSIRYYYYYQNQQKLKLILGILVMYELKEVMNRVMNLFAMAFLKMFFPIFYGDIVILYIYQKVIQDILFVRVNQIYLTPPLVSSEYLDNKFCTKKRSLSIKLYNQLKDH